MLQNFFGTGCVDMGTGCKLFMCALPKSCARIDLLLLSKMYKPNSPSRAVPELTSARDDQTSFCQFLKGVDLSAGRAEPVFVHFTDFDLGKRATRLVGARLFDEYDRTILQFPGSSSNCGTTFLAPQGVQAGTVRP